ncbi:MAG: hypothetical protein R3B96_05380 [Pirellulaceae bacterium]|nr:alpha/beta fold hydrolase [Planctomycetales bacterium]
MEPRSLRQLACGCGILVAMSLASGCAHFRPRLESQRLDAGYTLVLPGIEGSSVFNSNVGRALVNSGVPTAVEVDDWTTGFAVLALAHLRSRWRHETEAQRLADKIVAYHDAYPGRPIYLVGHSGGAAMAVFALERLPADVSVTRVILLSPALAPEYDLTTALSHADGGIWNFYSPSDVVFCGTGTTLFGTMDGAWRPAAGSAGFRAPSGEIVGDLEAGAYLPVNGAARSLADHQWGPELRQVGYRPEMILTGNPGGHFGWTTQWFVSQYLAPLIQLDFR